MFIWPNRSVTGSVRVAELDAFWKALDAGEPIDDWAEFFPPGVTAADYPRPEPPAKPEPPKPAPRKATSAKE